MTVVGNIPRPLGRGTRKLERLTATGPAADVSVPATGGADVAISISPEIKTVEDVGVQSISGLPANIAVGNIATSATSVTLHAVNPTATAITVSAGSVTVKVEVEGY